MGLQVMNNVNIWNFKGGKCDQNCAPTATIMLILVTVNIIYHPMMANILIFKIILNSNSKLSVYFWKNPE